MTRARPILAIDAETDPFRHGRRPLAFVWGQYDGRHFRYWWEDPGAFTRQLFGRRAIAYAHFGGGFDFHLIAPYFPWGTRIRPTNDGITQVWPAGGRVELRDSWPILRHRLAEYRKGSIDYAKHERGVREEYRDEILEYLRTDVIALHEWVTRFVEDYGRRPVTIGQAALAELRRIQGIDTPRVGPEWDSLFRPYFFGGRCEVLRPGVYSARFDVWDINSAYPSVMREPHPWGHRYQELERVPDDPDRLRQCFIRCEARSLGAWPYREHGMTSYPADERTREYHVTGHEWVAAEETGHLQAERVHQVLETLDSIDFTPYVSHFWAKRCAARESGDRAGELIAKGFLNSLWGKLAQDARKSRTYQITDEGTYWRDLAPEGWERMGHLGGKRIAQRRAELPYPPYLQVATAASISGALRARLWRVWQQSEGVLYLDTDSLACARLGASETVGAGLGQWKHLGAFDWAAIGGKKLYSFRYLDGSGFKTASKGVKLTPRDIERVARGGAIEYHQSAPTFRAGGPPIWHRRIVKSTVRKTHGRK